MQKKRQKDLAYRDLARIVLRKAFTVMVVKYWQRLPRETVKSPSLEILKTQLDIVLGTLL